jgi:hypothetical protein
VCHCESIYRYHSVPFNACNVALGYLYKNCKGGFLMSTQKLVDVDNYNSGQIYKSFRVHE